MKNLHTDRRTLLAGAGAAFASLSLGAGTSWAGQSDTATGSGLPLDLVHPDLRPIIRNVEAMAAKAPPFSWASLPAARGPSPFAEPPLGDIAWERRVIPVPGDNPPVPIFIINAKAGARRPAILHTHGGGFVGGRAQDSVRDLQEVCKALDCVAVSVDYRLAPETTYAGSIEDNHAGLQWLHDNADGIGADPARIAVMGESAGGGHAALLAIAARDRGKVPVIFQCLTYPMLDDRTASTRSVPPHVGTLIWTAQQNRLGWEGFLGQKPGGTIAPRGAVPAREVNLRGLPPAFIGVGSLDLFCAEDMEYAQRLYAAGVMTELIVVPGCFHGFDLIAKKINAPLGRWFGDVRVDALRRAFAPIA